MSLSRIKAILLQEYYMTIHSTEVVFDIVVFPIISIVLFAFLSRYLMGFSDASVSQTLMVGILLWQLIYLTQYSVTVGSLWNIWARNLSNMFVSPLSTPEYLTAYSVSGILKAMLMFFLGAGFLYFFFGFSIFSLGGINLVFFFINLITFAISIGIVILGFIFRYGSRVNAFAWGFLPLLQPLTGALFPVQILPVPLRILAYALPPTYVFEAARYSLETSQIAWHLISFSIILNALYLIIALWFFNHMFTKSKETGQFVRNES